MLEIWHVDSVTWNQTENKESREIENKSDKFE